MESGKPQHAKRQMESAGVWGSTGWGSSDKNEGRVGAVFSAEQWGRFSLGGAAAQRERRRFLARKRATETEQREWRRFAGACRVRTRWCGLDQMGARVGRFGLGAFYIECTQV